MDKSKQTKVCGKCNQSDWFPSGYCRPCSRRRGRKRNEQLIKDGKRVSEGTVKYCKVCDKNTERYGTGKCKLCCKRYNKANYGLTTVDKSEREITINNNKAFIFWYRSVISP